MSSLTYRVVPVVGLDRTSRDAMFAIFEQYYAEVDRVRFEGDLDKKDHAIVLYDRVDGSIQGFSTLQAVTARFQGVTHYGVFSGDTVVSKEYWGTGALGRAFLWYMLRQRIRRPFRPLWWFLISKGYKTYLLMANNFDEHWPRVEHDTPAEAQHVLDAFAHQMFGESYDAQRGVIEHTQSLGQLRDHVAGIDCELVEGNPRVAFFQRQNPGWAQGHELACIARMRWSMPLAYIWKKRATMFRGGAR